MKGNLRRLLAIFLVLMLLSADVCAIAEAVATLTLPSALQIIEEEAFAGNTSIEKVIVPDGTTEIRSRAFADSSMTELVLPDSLTFIAEDAFEGCGEFALTVPENCYAYDRCVELGLIKVDEPDPSVIESAHPYPDEFDYTWTYDAGEGTESVTITFSADTETEEDYDFIYIYTLDDVQVGQYSGTELAGQSVTIDGTGFKLRLTSDEAWDGGNTYYGFKLDSIVPKKAVPLTFESITAESSAVNAGEIIRWTVATTGGKTPVYYDYTVLLGEEEVATGTVEAPNAIAYTPVRAGEYKLSVIARDSADVVLPAQVSDAVTVAPSTAYPESAHPYAANTDQSWVYAAEENVESLTVTFSEETKTESGYDYIWLYDQNGTQIGKYAGTELTGQSIEIIGNAFTIRLTSDGSNEYHGFTITNIEKYIPGPLGFVSLTVDKAKAKTGELITWTMETEGGRRPVTYEYTVTLNGETKYTGSVIRPEQITYVPMTAGDYTMSVVAKDAEGNELPAQTSKVRITERGETAAEYFTVVQTSGSFGKITAYTGTDTAVVIPSVIGEYTIEEIGNEAFENNDTIISVELPLSLKKIGSYAFNGCANLVAVHIADSVETIGSYAFYNCVKLMDVNFPLGWISAGSNGNIFKGTRLTTITIPEGVTLIPENAFRYCANFTNFNLPESVNSIGNYAFDGCTGLTSINLPDGVTDIPSGAFRNCVKLESICIPKSTVSIGQSAFEGCSGIKQFELPETIESIGSYAFEGCSAITEMYIPESVASIGSYAFYNCSVLRSINYPVGWTTAGSNGNIFKGTALKTISIPEGIESIPANAFRYCSNFSYFELPESLLTLGNNVFEGCTGLTTLDVPDSVTAISSGLVKNCSGLVSVELSNATLSIGSSAFYGCDHLPNITIPETVTSIGQSAFEGCTAFTSLYIPESVTNIGSYAFNNCSKLSEINYPIGWTSAGGNGSIFKGTAITSFHIPEGVEVIPANAFKSCANILSVTIPGSVESIGSDAFRYCDGLTNVVIPEGTVSIGQDAFSHSDHLESVSLPSTLESIGSWAFVSCPNLQNVNYPVNLKSVGGNGSVFGDCPKLTTIELPYGITALPANVFEGWDSLISIDIPYSVISIGGDAFKDCVSLKQIDIPNSVISIGSDAFRNCDSLTSVVIPEGVISLGQDAFSHSANLKTVYLPSTLESIGSWAFVSCPNLEKINYPINLKSVGGNGSVFGDCPKLTTIELPYGVTKLPANVFESWDSLTHIDIPDSVISIGGDAFKGCSDLAHIWIPSTIIEGGIASSAFSNVPTDTMTIHGESGSYAETFASEKGYAFSTEPFEYVPATLSGTVTDATGAPLSGVTVTVYKGPTTNYPFGSTTTDSTGAWSVSNVKVGSCYTIGFVKEGYNFTPNYEAVYNIVENHVYTTVIGNAAPAVLSAEFAVDTVCLDTAASITVTTEEDAGVLAMYAENRDWGRCAVWSVASAQTEVVDGVRVWNVQYTFNTTGDRTLSFAASTDGKTEGDEKTASIKVVEAEMDITVQDFELSRYIAEPEDTISIYGTVSGGDRELQLVTVSLCPDGDISQGVEIWSSNPGTTEFDLSTIPELVVGQTYSGTDYAVAQVYNRAMLLDAESTYEATGDSSVTMEPGCDYEIVVNAALTDGTTIEEEVISRSVIVQETTVYTGEVATKTSEKGKEFIKSRENCYLYVYDDKTLGKPYDPTDPNRGNPTIGWGHKIVDGESFTTITQEEADALFEKDLQRKEGTVNLFLSLTEAKVNQQQYDALSSFFYNGNGKATGSTTCMFRLFQENANNLDAIPDWRIYNQLANYYNRSESSTRVGLHRRRLDEAQLFTEGDYERDDDWYIEDWVRNGEVVPDDWKPREVEEKVTDENIVLTAPVFVDYPEAICNGEGFEVIWNPVDGANYYNLWYRLDTWEEAKYLMCRNEWCYMDFELGDAKALWISLYAMVDGTHHSPGTTIQINISDVGDLEFTGYTLGQTTALDISSVSSSGYSVGWTCLNAVEYKYKALILSEMPKGDDQSGKALKVHEGKVQSNGMKIPKSWLMEDRYIKLAVAPISKNGNQGTWRWIGFHVINGKPILSTPIWDVIPDSVTSGESFTISWKPVDKALYYNVWYRLDGGEMQYQKVYAPDCSADLLLSSPTKSTVHISVYAMTAPDNHSKTAADKSIPISGKASDGFSPQWPMDNQHDISTLYYYSDGDPHKCSEGLPKENVYTSGIDVSAPKGTPIRAVESGTIELIKSGGGFGLHLRINHGNGYYSLYAHMNQICLNQNDSGNWTLLNGQASATSVEGGYYHNSFSGSYTVSIPIKKGQIIGYSGNSGNGGYHLHFEIFKMTNGKWDKYSTWERYYKDTYPELTYQTSVYTSCAKMKDKDEYSKRLYEHLMIKEVTLTSSKANAEAASYVNKTINSYVYQKEANGTYGRALRNLRDGKSVVFFFEGAGANSSTKVRQYALCTVVRLVNNTPTIVFENEYSTTIPDHPRDENFNDGDGMPTVVDGVYDILSWNHKDRYPALKVSGASVVRFSSTVPNGGSAEACGNINIHHRTEDGLITSGTPNSQGCFLVGKIANGYAEYVNFLRACKVIGENSGIGSLLTSTGVDMGIVVVDRDCPTAEAYLNSLYGKTGADKLRDD